MAETTRTLQGEWGETRKQAICIVHNDAFWKALKSLMPASKEDLMAVDPGMCGGHVLQNPIR